MAISRHLIFAFCSFALLNAGCSSPAPEASLTLARDGHWLAIRGQQLPGGEVRLNYLEAYCRANSTDADWATHTVLKHSNELITLSSDRREMRMRDTLADGVIVEHTITAGHDEIDFRLAAHNPGGGRSEAHWAQPCVRLGTFTGFSPDLKQGDLNDYLSTQPRRRHVHVEVAR